jgi:tRNA(Ile)-lysidine synthase
MVSSKKLPKSSLVEKKHTCLISQLKLFLKAFFRSQRLSRPSLLIAFSGGLDSTVLLHAFHQLQQTIPFYLHATHVHHGLSKNADQWASFCEKACASLGVPMSVVPVRVNPSSGLGIEAAARKARYEALCSIPIDFVCLGHHQDDQAETLLLQLARGAGVKGLSGMAQIDVKRRLLRPLLNIPRADLLSYAKQHQLQWIDDESNDDVHFDRNFIRHTLIPTFAERYQHITKTLARSAMHMADASAMLEELAELDATTMIDYEQLPYGALKLAVFSQLSLARQKNLVRWWFANNQISMPSAALLQQIIQQLHAERSDAAIKVKVADSLYLMRYQQFAYLVREYESLPTINILWQGEEVVVLPNHSRLFFNKRMGEGFAYQRGGSDIRLRIKNREGGEYFKPDLARPRRTLKHLMQTSQIPPWQREQLPLIFMDETLVIIPNVGVDAHLKAANHEMGLTVHWQAA